MVSVSEPGKFFRSTPQTPSEITIPTPSDPLCESTHKHAENNKKEPVS